LNLNKTKYELQNVISGESGSSHDSLIQTIASYLRRSQRSGPKAEEKHKNKPQETERLIKFALINDLIISEIDQEKFISHGAEQKVYIKDEFNVIKLNDCVYYASWEDYFYNLIFHNYFFSDTRYQLLGFNLTDDVLYAVVQQPFVKSTEQTELNHVQSFLAENGFINSKNNDYYHPELGIIIEDLHDENVLTNNGLLYFIDTVFYINPDVFWN
jgi:hypothetical protein